MSWYAFGRALQGGQAAFNDAHETLRRDAMAEEEKNRYQAEQAWRERQTKYQEGRDLVGDQRHDGQQRQLRAARVLEALKLGGSATGDDRAVLNEAGYGSALESFQVPVGPAADSIDAVVPGTIPSQSVEVGARLRLTPEQQAARRALERQQSFQDRLAALDQSSPTYQRDAVQLAREFGTLDPWDDPIARTELETKQRQAAIDASRSTIALNDFNLDERKNAPLRGVAAGYTNDPKEAAYLNENYNDAVILAAIEGWRRAELTAGRAVPPGEAMLKYKTEKALAIKDLLTQYRRAQDPEYNARRARFMAAAGASSTP